MNDIGLTHIALPATNIDASIAFYAKYAAMQVVHRRIDPQFNTEVVWVSDRTRPFVIVLIEAKSVDSPLKPIAHLGVGCATREKVDALCAEAKREGVLLYGPMDLGYPVGYFAILSDPDGHALELSHGQEVGLAVESASER
jgi:catechol 2,3-dioxygenase-like lactoylglutathione lyase family enzyme